MITHMQEVKYLSKAKTSLTGFNLYVASHKQVLYWIPTDIILRDDVIYINWKILYYHRSSKLQEDVDRR